MPLDDVLSVDGAAKMIALTDKEKLQKYLKGEIISGMPAMKWH